MERVLAGDTDNLKEYPIALEVFDRSPDYNPKIDALVRVEARRLRSRLEQYYATEGMHDSIRIRFPSGTYVPEIVRHRSAGLPAEPAVAERPGDPPALVAACRRPGGGRDGSRCAAFASARAGG